MTARTAKTVKAEAVAAVEAIPTDGPETATAAAKDHAPSPDVQITFHDDYRGRALSVFDGVGEVWSGDVPANGVVKVNVATARRLGSFAV